MIHMDRFCDFHQCSHVTKQINIGMTRQQYMSTGSLDLHVAWCCVDGDLQPSGVRRVRQCAKACCQSHTISSLLTRSAVD